MGESWHGGDAVQAQYSAAAPLILGKGCFVAVVT